MSDFNPGDRVEVQVDIDGQIVWAQGTVQGASGNSFMVDWSWKVTQGNVSSTYNGSESFSASQIRKAAAGTAPQPTTPQPTTPQPTTPQPQAPAAANARFKAGDDVEIQITIGTSKVWALGKVKSVSGNSYTVDYRYQQGNSIWGGGDPITVQESAIRLPAPEILDALKATRDFEAKVKPGTAVEVLVDFKGKKAWVPGKFQSGSNGNYYIDWQAPDGSGGMRPFGLSEIRLPAPPVQLVYSPGSPGTESAAPKDTTIAGLFKYRYAINGRPFDTSKDFAYGPGSHQNVYGHTRQFFLVQLPNRQVGIIWQDKDDGSIHLTKIDVNYNLAETLNLTYSAGQALAAATVDPQGNSYYLTIQTGEGQSGAPLSAILYKADPAGKLIGQQPLETTEDKLDIFMFREKDDQAGMNVADMRFLNDQLGVILSRQMYSIHFGAIALVFDAKTLKLVQNLGQTSGHSWGNILLENTSGDFVGLDLGDNYPRGINLHRFNAAGNRSRVVYTFKTLHGTKPNNDLNQGPYPAYTEISSPSKTYYRWSNDNRTYTELGGIIEGSGTYTIVFVGEPSESQALNNTRTDDELNDARNIGLVQVTADFQPIRDGSKKSVVTSDFVLTPGITEKTTFYGFLSEKNDQQNTGVVWLTNYKDKEQANASRLKTAKLSDGNILLLWETWTPYQYVSTFAMKVTQKGQILTQPVDLGQYVRLSRQDDLLVVGTNIFVAGGNGEEKKLELNLIQIK